MAPHPFPQAHFPNPDTPDQTELTISLICRALNPPDGAGAAVFRQYVRGYGYAVRYQRGRDGDGKGRDGEVDDCVIPPGSCGL